MLEGRRGQAPDESRDSPDLVVRQGKRRHVGTGDAFLNGFEKLLVREAPHKRSNQARAAAAFSVDAVASAAGFDKGLAARFNGLGVAGEGVSLLGVSVGGLP